MEKQIRSRLRKARLLSREAGRRAIQLRPEVRPEWKSNESYVTRADRELESYLKREILDQHPRDEFVGEETEPVRGEGSYSWIVDPIDGTASYGSGLPIWAVSIGIGIRGRMAGGVLWMPDLQREFFGIHSPAINVANQAPDSLHRESLLCVPSDVHRKFAVRFPGKTRALGSTAFHMALVLGGTAVGALLGRRHLWDLAVGWGLSRETNHQLRTLDGSDPPLETLAQGKRSPEPLVFGHEAILERITETIEPKPDETMGS